MFKAEIKEVSREITAKERVALKDTTAMVKLDQATQLENIQIDPDFYASASFFCTSSSFFAIFRASSPALDASAP